jgi:hypothetical protein
MVTKIMYPEARHNQQLYNPAPRVSPRPYQLWDKLAVFYEPKDVIT